MTDIQHAGIPCDNPIPVILKPAMTMTRQEKANALNDLYQGWQRLLYKQIQQLTRHDDSKDSKRLDR